jgi:chromosome segregation ATPase
MNQEVKLPELPGDVIDSMREAHKYCGGGLEGCHIALKGREDQLKSALESLAEKEAEIARLKQQLERTEAARKIQHQSANWQMARAEAAEAELDLKAQDNDKLRSVLQGVIKTARRRGAELAVTRKALDLKHSQLMNNFDRAEAADAELWVTRKALELAVEEINGYQRECRATVLSTTAEFMEAAKESR